MYVKISDYLNYVSLDQSYTQYFNLFIITAIIFVILEIIKIISIKNFRKLAESTENKLDNITLKIIKGFDLFFVLTLSIFISIQFLSFQQDLKNALNKSSIIILILYITKSVINIISHIFKSNILKNAPKEDFDPTIFKIFINIIKFIFWIIAIAIILQNFGYNVSALIGGLGIAGIAIAFGLRSILEDVFAFFSLYFDKPFTIGDYIEIEGGESGTVKKIGLKSTHLKTFYGKTLIISNKKLTQKTIANFKNLKSRNINFKLNLDNQNTTEKIKKAQKIIETIISKITKATFKRALISSIDDFSIKLSIVYRLEPMSFVEYIKIKNEIYFQILKQFEKENIKLKFIDYKNVK